VRAVVELRPRALHQLSTTGVRRSESTHRSVNAPYAAVEGAPRVRDANISPTQHLQAMRVVKSVAALLRSVPRTGARCVALPRGRRSRPMPRHPHHTICQARSRCPRSTHPPRLYLHAPGLPGPDCSTQPTQIPCVRVNRATNKPRAPSPRGGAERSRATLRYSHRHEARRLSRRAQRATAAGSTHRRALGATSGCW